ncbi:MAG: serine/threonine dehydratase [Alphaproteobacteria bacterium 16-39-46]|nr:MAG: serine/threonine dehydratase [Alphaproteobacteria bacterium 16-39-46]OZA42800.1 MAG: serine/threonine dehydratase [Alphaproteobacteria bacterium 17-39-52]
MTPDVVTQAYNRIKDFINRTPLLESETLNERLKSRIYFKFEGMQKVGAFKARGALNTLLHLKEQNALPKEVVAYSSGNHAQAVAWAAKQLGIKATVIVPSVASKVKIAATKAYGAEVIVTKERQEAEDLAHEKSKTCFLLPPYDHDDVIAGQGTVALEAWMEEGNFDAIFAPCGGGGLISGTYLASCLFSKSVKVYACEPQIANDAAESYKTGCIKRFETTPMTIADGTRTLGISERTFQYIKKLAGFYEISEEEIVYWTQWLTHLLKINLEPTCALGMAGAYSWIKRGNYNKKILVIVSGGNMDPSTYLKIWENSHLESMPKID